MELQYWIWIAVGLSFSLYIGIAIWSRAGSTKEFYVAGGGVHPIANGMATAADWMSAASFISMAGIISFGGYDGLSATIALSRGQEIYGGWATRCLPTHSVTSPLSKPHSVCVIVQPHTIQKTKHKQKLISSIFPEKIEFDGKKCRTIRINDFLRYILQIDKELPENKKGQISKNMSLSRLVESEGIEPSSKQVNPMLSTSIVFV